MTDTFAGLIAGSISSLHGNEILKSSIQAAVPFHTDTASVKFIQKTHSLFFYAWKNQSHLSVIRQGIPRDSIN